MTNALKVLLFLAGGTSAAAIGAYATGALDPLFGSQPPAAVAQLPADDGKPATAEATGKEDRVDAAGKPAPAGEQPAAASEQPAPSADEPAQSAQEAAAPAESQPPKDVEIAAAEPNAPTVEPKPEPTVPIDAGQQPTAPAAGPQLPTFDLVRVEADGSTVIAGKAAPNARIELLNGDQVLGGTTSGATGDFVVVLDSALAPGDYQVTIRATGKDGVPLLSAQTAIVSVPENTSGQVLAMIEEPGKPSEIITMPQPDAPPSKPAEAATADPAKPAEQPAAPADAGQQPPAASTEQPKPGETDMAAVEPQPEKPVAQPEAPAAQPQPEKPAASADKPAAPATQTPAVPTLDVGVEAVEIEGNRIFVAGRAPVGSKVRVYANEILLGESTASAAGRFLVEAVRELPVGSYLVRADVMSPDGKQVLARAAVPFEREPGENIAAVASPAATDESAAEPAQTASGEAAPASEPAKPAATTEAKAPAATTETPAVSAEADVPAAEKPVADQPAAAADATPAPANTPVAQEPAAPAAVAEKPAEVAAADPKTDVTAPPLQNVNSAVIIRRGDTLWRISKRVYGRGVRYSTIYLANQDQIRDPDMIWPGQVFGVPRQTQEGETADMSKIGEQATTKPQ